MGDEDEGGEEHEGWEFGSRLKCMALNWAQDL